VHTRFHVLGDQFVMTVHGTKDESPTVGVLFNSHLVKEGER